MIAIVIDVKTRAKPIREMDTLFDDGSSELGAVANANARHQNRIGYRGILFNPDTW